MWKYIKAAFVNRWNMLGFLGGLGVVALSGPFWEVTLPLVLAGEAAYLGFVGAHPKFQKYVEAQEHQEAARTRGTTAEIALNQILAALPVAQVQRFEQLRVRRSELRGIAAGIHNPAVVADSPATLEQLQLAGLDRLLWIYLRLLYTQHCLERFLGQTSLKQLEGDIRSLESRIAEMQGDDPQRVRMRRSLEDNLTTSRDRLVNYRKAKDNSELVQLEIDRIENKIRSLSELAVNRQEPEFISGQVDEVATSMVQTERTMNELSFVTGLVADEAVPSLVKREKLTQSG